MVSAWIMKEISSTMTTCDFFLFLTASLLLFISSPLSVLAAKQELTQLGRVRLYPLKGKFLMLLQNPPFFVFTLYIPPFS